MAFLLCGLRSEPAAKAAVFTASSETPRSPFATVHAEDLRAGGLFIRLVPTPRTLFDALTSRFRERRAAALLVKPDTSTLVRIAAWVEAGELRALVSQRFPMPQAAAAHALLEAGGVTGKVILETPPE